MTFGFKLAIAAAHFSVYIAVAICIWIFSKRADFYTSRLALRSLPSIYWGYACFAIATSYEIAEHMNDQWVYISQISGLNNLFYSFIVFGVGFIALGLKKDRLLDSLVIAGMTVTPFLYGLNDSKTAIQIPQLIVAIIFVYKWFMVMRDWRVFLYLLFSNVIALGFGIALIATGNQIYHLFIGPASAIGLLILGYVAWVRPLQQS
ncbi:hypothetical protein S7335_3650 [Synechococcus sp. PCC 7335]|uniref:hypothetical protein n=1 Tax=Synechococcus sp. (strain ATCC 29403 / PCC 7335) TaxID=91464 RepID=UPI00017ED1B8|nr:hypothetical protein [Synechococcus sp. PCC 7335]EDX85947.1 hypothetical protein S7335_3650 [Synechococcus sp. PCC 7335]